MSGAQGEMGVLLGAARTSSNVETLAEGALLLRGFVAAEAASIFEIVRQIAVAAPFRHMVTPGGYRMSVAMTNCGEVGWTTNRSGYRYARFDPETNLPWPPMPPTFRELARRAACRAGFAGGCCLNLTFRSALV
jgi:alkylated DNA repair protein (DNA oxidative demethylase)